MGHHPKQRVARIAETDDYASPELINTNSTDAIVLCRRQLLKMHTGVDRIFELVGQFSNLLSNPRLKAGETLEELLGEEQCCHLGLLRSQCLEQFTLGP